MLADLLRDYEVTMEEVLEGLLKISRWATSACSPIHRNSMGILFPPLPYVAAVAQSSRWTLLHPALVLCLLHMHDALLAAHACQPTF